MNRWYATFAPQHTMLSATATRANGTIRGISDEQLSKPAPREAPTSA